jgi:hypothetical protein
MLRFAMVGGSVTGSPHYMREELAHALMEALYELEVLPDNPDGALLGVYAVMDDLRAALERTEALDRPGSPLRN